MPAATPRKKNISIIPSQKEFEKAVQPAQKTLRVVAYCRVSTLLEQQESSFEAQKSHYTEMILSNPNWNMAGIYADDRISGTDMRKRDEFNRMLQDCEAGKIDLVLTKSISRFARNTADMLNVIRMLRAKEIAIYFEKERINTLEDTGEMLVTILGSQAQEESRNLSENTRWGIARRFENGTVIVNHKKFMGYTKNEDRELVIVPEEAEVVRLIFRLYLEGMSVAGIKRHLEGKGILTATELNKWNEATIYQMISNEKYMGDALLQKTYTADFLTKKKLKNNGEVRQYYITDDHEAIIPREIFHAVQQEMRRRAERHRPALTKQAKEKKKGYSSKYILSNLLLCGECGHPYRRLTWTRNGEKRIVWRCASRAEHGTKYCQHSATLDEGSLQRAVMQAIRRVARDSEFGSAMQNNITLVIGMYADSIESGNSELDKRIAELEIQMLQMVRENPDFNDEEFLKRYRAVGGEIQRLKEEKIMKILPSPVLPDGIAEKIKSVERSEMAFDPVLVGQLIEKIVVRNAKRVEVVFKSGLVENAVLETED